MAKKKAMKVVASTIIATTSSIAVFAFAPVSAEAASDSIDEALKAYKAKAWVAYKSWQSENGALKWASKVKPFVKDADNAYWEALNLIYASNLSSAQKEEKVKALDAEMKFVESAKNYITALYGGYDIKAEIDGATYETIYEAFEKVTELKKKTAKVWHAKNRTLLQEQYKESIEEVVNAANAKYYLNKALWNVLDGRDNIEKAKEWLKKAAPYIEKIDLSTSIGKELEKHKEKTTESIEIAENPKPEPKPDVPYYPSPPVIVIPEVANNGETVVNLNGEFRLNFTEQVLADDVEKVLVIKDEDDTQVDATVEAVSVDNGYAKVYKVTIQSYDNNKKYRVSISANSITNKSGYKNKLAWAKELKIKELHAPSIILRDELEDGYFNAAEFAKYSSEGEPPIRVLLENTNAFKDDEVIVTVKGENINDIIWYPLTEQDIQNGYADIGIPYYVMAIDGEYTFTAKLQESIDQSILSSDSTAKVITTDKIKPTLKYSPTSFDSNGETAFAITTSEPLNQFTGTNWSLLSNNAAVKTFTVATQDTSTINFRVNPIGKNSTSFAIEAGEKITNVPNEIELGNQTSEKITDVAGNPVDPEVSITPKQQQNETFLYKLAA